MLSLRSYQDEDVRTMQETLDERGVVWNLSDMRTGKLVELIALVNRSADVYKRVLVVAPLSTLLNVRDEFERWAEIRVHVNPPTYPDGFFNLLAEVGLPTMPFVVAINPEKLRDEGHWVFKQDWDLLALDEAHRYRGRNSQQTKGMLKLAKRAHRTVIMTGTPLMNGLPKEIFPLLKATEPAQWSSFWRFLADHAVKTPGWGGAAQDERAPWTKTGKRAIQEYLAPMVVRRTYAEVRPELPPMIEQTIPLDLRELDPFHYSEYQRLQKDWQVQVNDEQLDVPTKLALTTRLRQYAASPRNLGHMNDGGKIGAIREWVEDQPPGKGVIWCWHKAMAEAIYYSLAAAYLVTGDIPADVRHQHCDWFQRAPSGVLVATIGSLKEGITLDTASWAVFAEKSWLPADNDQAAARILGEQQTGSPLVVSFVCEGTIEERVERVLARKDNAINDFMIMKELAADER